MKRFTLVFCIVALVAAGVCGQDKPKPQTTTIEIPKTFKYRRAYKVQYDKFKDQTRIFSGFFPASKSSLYIMTNRMISIGSAFFFDGQMLIKAPSEFYILFETSGGDWAFLKDHHFYAIADGERMDLGDGEHDGDVKLGGVSEYLIYKLTSENFHKIASAKKLEIKIGQYETELKDDTIQSFKNIESLAVVK